MATIPAKQQAPAMLANFIKTRQYQPQGHDTSYRPGGRVTAFVPDCVPYRNSIRLIDVGAVVNGGEDVLYPRNSGVLELIESIRVLKDKDVLAQCQGFSAYGAKQNMKATNQTLMQVQQIIKRTEMGMYRRFQPPTNPWGTDGAVLHQWRSAQGRNELTGDPTTTARGRIDLGDYIELIPGLPFIPAIPGLRIEIRWKNLTDATRPNILRFSDPITGYSILEPLLLMDQILDPSPQMQSGDLPLITFPTVVYEEKQIAEIDDGERQMAVGQELQSMQGQVLLTMEWSMLPAVDEDIQAGGMGYNYSSAQFQEVMEFTYNGSKLLQYRGVFAPALKQYYQWISTGALAVPAQCYLYDVDEFDEIFSLPMQALVGRLSYGSVYVNGFVNSMVYDYSRTGNAVFDMQTSALTLQVWSRVMRTLKITRGKPMLGTPQG